MANSKIVTFECFECGQPFDVAFWWDLPEKVECEHCGHVWETDWEGDVSDTSKPRRCWIVRRSESTRGVQA